MPLSICHIQSKGIYFPLDVMTYSFMLSLTTLSHQKGSPSIPQKDEVRGFLNKEFLPTWCIVVLCVSNEN